MGDLFGLLVICLMTIPFIYITYKVWLSNIKNEPIFAEKNTNNTELSENKKLNIFKKIILYVVLYLALPFVLIASIIVTYGGSIVLWIIFLCSLLGYKLFRRWFGKFIGNKVAGWIGVFIFGFITLAIFFGDHIVKVRQFKHLCETQAIYKIYDLEAIDKYNATKFKFDSTAITSVSELAKLKERYPNMDKRATRVNTREGERGHLLYVYWKNDSHFSSQLLHGDTGKVIKEYQNFFARGGWLCRLLDPSGGGCSLRTCESNRYGPFKDK